MFDDFMTQQQIDEIIPKEYDDWYWCALVYGSTFQEEE